jgi:chromatin modification-related protein VID21
MRKLAKKRETSLQKQQHAAGLAAMRKANEVPQPRAPVHTPQDFSRLKHDREIQLAERMAQLQQRQEANRRAAIQQARNNVQNPQQQGLPNGIPQQPLRNSATTTANPANGLSNSNGQNQLAVPAQNRPRAAVPPNQIGGQAPMTNGLGVHQMPMNGVPQAQMQGMQGQHRLPVPNPALDINLVTQARRISEQQRQAVQMQQQSQHQGQNTQVHNSPPNMRNGVNGMSQQGFLPNMMPPFNPGNTNGVSTPPTSGMSVGTPGSGTASSPQMGQPGQPQPLPNCIVPPVNILDAQFRQKFPNCNQEQIHRMISDHLAKPVHNHQRQQLSQAAMNAAAGGNGNGQPRVPSGVENSPQLYAQMLRAQKERQQRDSEAANQPQRSGSANGGGQGK